MSSNTLKFLLASLLIFVMQVMVNNFVNLSVYIYIFIIPFIIFSLPYKFNTIIVMILSFLTGILIDIAGNGILGLNAAALTMAGALRNFILFRLVNVKNVNMDDTPGIKDMGIWMYLAYTSLLYLVFFMVYIPLETMSMDHLLFKLVRLVIGVAVNVTLTALLSSVIKFNRRD